MQYWHRRLQRSVTETRRLRSGRAKTSVGADKDSRNPDNDSDNDEGRLMIDE
jgi:hypothetical protein